jgi:hypothetical protein
MRVPGPIWRRIKVFSTMAQTINALAAASALAAVAFPVFAGPTNSLIVLNVGSIAAAHVDVHRPLPAWIVADRPQNPVVSGVFHPDSAAMVSDPTTPVQPDQVQMHSRFEAPDNGLKMTTVHYDYGPAGLRDDVSTLSFKRKF